MIYKLYQVEHVCLEMIKRFGFQDTFYSYLVDIRVVDGIVSKYRLHLENLDKTQYLEVTIPANLKKRQIKIKRIKEKTRYKKVYL